MIFKEAKLVKKRAEMAQDAIFRKMSPSQKIKLASDFFRFAKILIPSYRHYGTRNTTEKNRKNSR